MGGIADIHILTAVVAIIMTAIVVVGIQTSNWRRPAPSIITVPGAAMIVLYIVASVLIYYLA